MSIDTRAALNRRPSFRRTDRSPRTARSDSALRGCVPTGVNGAIVRRVAARDFEICIDATDPDRLRPFWRTALGYVDHLTAEGSTDLVDLDGIRPTIWFQEVPESKTSKNRIHLDIHVEAGDHDELANMLVGLDGTILAVWPCFTTVADPEGNELCLNRH
jgi:Glyoxalase-like domain